MEDEFVTVTINKPIFGSFCSIDKRKLDEASRTNRMLKITLLGVGTAVVSPKWWFDTSVKKEKRVVNFRNNPMTFVYNYLPLENKFKKNKTLSVNQLSLL